MSAGESDLLNSGMRKECPLKALKGRAVGRAVIFVLLLCFCTAWSLYPRLNGFHNRHGTEPATILVIMSFIQRINQKGDPYWQHSVTGLFSI